MECSAICFLSAAQISPATISEDGSSRRLLASFSFEVAIMYGNVSVNDCIEELDLTVCSYKLLRKYGCSLVSDILSIPLKSLWYEVCNKSRASFREILTKLNDAGYRFP